MLVFFSEKILASKLFALLGCHVVLLLCSVKERKGHDGDGEMVCRAFVIQESSWRKTLVFAMSMSQNISFHDKALLSGRIGRASAST